MHHVLICPWFDFAVQRKQLNWTAIQLNSTMSAIISRWFSTCWILLLPRKVENSSFFEGTFGNNFGFNGLLESMGTFSVGISGCGFYTHGIHIFCVCTVQWWRGEKEGTFSVKVTILMLPLRPQNQACIFSETFSWKISAPNIGLAHIHKNLQCSANVLLLNCKVG